MKKAVSVSLMMLFGIAAQAQTDNVTLNVKLNPIQTLIVNPNQEVVNLEYSTKDDYANGVTSGALADHLSVFSTGGFAVSVKSSTAQLTNSAPSQHGNIDANTIQIIATDGNTPITSATNSQVALSNTDQTIVTSAYGAVDKTINIEYKGADANTYINHYIAGQTPTVYTTELTYTIVAQ